VQLIDVLMVAGNGRAVVPIQSEWMEVGLWVSEIGNPSVVLQHLAVCLTAGAELVGVVVGEDNPKIPAARSAVAFEFRSYLKLNEMNSTEGATAAEVEVVGTCVYYYLSEAGHDARGRIGRITVYLVSSPEAHSQIRSVRASCSVGQHVRNVSTASSVAA